jgi:hypothetical protein
VLDDRVTTPDLLEAWRDATRAAELANRLAKLAAENAERADLNANAADEVATLAEQAAQAAAAAADRARASADHARDVARQSRDGMGDAEAEQSGTLASETEARDAYHNAEADSRARHAKDQSDPESGTTRPAS